MPDLSLSGRSTVESFASNLGLDARPAADGSYNFVFERLGTLSIMPTDREAGALIALTRAPRSNSADYERKLLAAGGIDPDTNELIYSAITEDGSHVFAVDFDEARWSLPELDGTLGRLAGFHDATR